jgi:hypothetical protein
VIARLIALADRGLLRLGWFLIPNTMLRLEDRRLAREDDHEMREQLDRSERLHADPWRHA